MSINHLTRTFRQQTACCCWFALPCILAVSLSQLASAAVTIQTTLFRSAMAKTASTPGSANR